ncbi:LysR family transcriptional regulator [Yinghuangia seranimata]|uniref:LysR family transcriptional regulator n=1 Tax=Yinghuangia seranimata TaxID=408067 RepID=UPI00248C339A|nr:LysR family transcriptional regulator [Yinghuangia seranimata]MDI2127244.1 LysR family transcriptional regulator [Yinghuangia seranimata]MDI2132189.1 LysR family transcriptional regulator [Yinghuangia seranimata]
MTLQQLRYLIAVVEHGSMTAAAHALYVVQPALSRSLQSLERELKIELFVRSGRGMVLTPEGVRVVHLAKKVLAGIRTIEDTVRTQGTAEPVLLRLGSTQTLAIEFISNLLPAFNRQRPDINVSVECYDSRDSLFAGLRKGQADLVLADLPVPGDLRVHAVRHHEVVLVSPQDVHLPDPVPWAALDGLPMILPSSHAARRRDFEMLFATRGIRPEVAMETDERGAWLACVAAGIGSVLWYAELATRFSSAVTVRSFTPPMERTIGFAWLRKPISPQVGALCAFARAKSGVEETEYT